MMNQPKYKIILIGDIRVGKTSFLYSILKKSQNNIQPTMGIQFMTTTLLLNGKNIKIQIWDTTGAQTYRSITSTYYKKAQGVILMFDISNHLSFENIKKWNQQVDQKSNQIISKILIGNKLDLIQSNQNNQNKPKLIQFNHNHQKQQTNKQSQNNNQRQVNEQQITNFCIDHQMTYKQTSALKGHNVKQAVIQLIQKIYQSKFDNHPNQYTSLFEINPNTTVLIDPPINTDNTNNSCSKCC